VGRFSEFFASARERIEALSALPEPLRAVDLILRTAETGRGLQAEDVASLIVWGRDPGGRAEIEAAARQVRDRVVGKTVEFIIPVYLTSFCQNECLYCGYRKSNPIAERIRLSLEDYQRELDLILSWGHRQIELVLSDDPEFGPDKLAAYVERTKRELAAVGGGLVALCSPVYEEADYRLLRAAGLDWVVEWQETFHQPHFDRWHSPGSPKQRYNFRLDVWDRTIAAGITHIALGVLLGLYDWHFDVLAVIEHGNYLRKTYGIEPHALGIPRLKPARGVLASQKPSRFSVSDEDYRFIVSLYHLAFPRSRLFFNTRESYEFNLSMVVGGDLFTVDCETLPGGYLRQHLPGQFSTHYYPSRREVVATLARQGFSCRYLAAEEELQQLPAAFPPAASQEAAVERWSREHGEIRARLEDWGNALEHLKSVPAPERRAAAAALREVLRFFATVGVEHFRFEETVLLASLGQQAEGTVQIPDLRRAHERFAVDLDRFERQVASYELSGDPTVLLSLGNRMIRELREHLDAEQKLFGDWPGVGAGPGLQAECD